MVAAYPQRIRQPRKLADSIMLDLACPPMHGFLSADHPAPHGLAYRLMSQTDAQDRQLTCESCHVENAYRKTREAECYACHREDDVHAGQEGESCGDCHRESGWGDDVFFEHDLTAFPLIGMHATTSCEQCHLTSTFKDTDSLCIDCHSDDDTHKKRLGAGCDLCHNPNDWLLWLFDHNTQTGFKIDGAHAELRCVSCHRVATDAHKPKLRSTCVSCHKTDDIHRGRFGAACERCHTTKTFRGAVIQ